MGLKFILMIWIAVVMQTILGVTAVKRSGRVPQDMTQTCIPVGGHQRFVVAHCPMIHPTTGWGGGGRSNTCMLFSNAVPSGRALMTFHAENLHIGNSSC
jgi:hypothetical protein